MSSERWQRAWELFDEATHRPAGQREAWLEQQCRDDPEMQRLVSGWLRADASSEAVPGDGWLGDGWLEDGWLAREVLAAPDLVGRRLGSCRITGRLGQGGMGTVYLAHQIDEIFDRQVAVKVLSWGPFGDEARRRFQTEQQAMGRVDHLAVARIFANGTTEEGFPYLVLEYVPGEPLDRYCTRSDLSLRAKITLLRRVCQGVSASHQQLIVHSDLKPSNILVRDDGQPKLLDFGIASLIDPRLGQARGVDGPMLRPMTPLYASPEQLRGEAISTASDVYSLGVILHQVLTGKPPSRDEHALLPSAQVSNRPALARRLRGDLDRIVLEALSEDPAQRYPSVESLNQDLGRYLDGRPVEARRGGRGYRVLKLIRRNKWQAATTIAAALMVCVFSGGLWLSKVRVEQERAGLLEVARFFFGVFEQAGPWVAEGVDVSLKEALDRSAGHLATGPPGEPHVHAALASVLGEIYLELGEPKTALSWSRSAHTLHAGLQGNESLAAATSLDLVGAAHRELGELDEAEVANRTALATLRASPSPDPRPLIRSLNNQVSIHCWREHYENALPISIEALALARSTLMPEDPEATEALLQHAQVMSHVGDPQHAVALYDEARSVLERTFPDGHPHLAMLHNNLARIHSDQGQKSDKIAHLQLADSLYRKLLGSNHYKRVKPLMGLAISAKERDEVEQAIALYRQAASIGRSTSSASFILRPTQSLARLLLAEGRCQEAEVELRASLEMLVQRESKPWRYFDAQSMLGESLACQGQVAEAANWLQQGLAGLEPFREQVPKPHQRATQRLAVLANLAP